MLVEVMYNQRYQAKQNESFRIYVYTLDFI